MRFICEDHDLPLTWSFSSYFAIEPFLVLPAFSFLFYFTFLSFSFALLFFIFFSVSVCLSIYLIPQPPISLSFARSFTPSISFYLLFSLSLLLFSPSLSLTYHFLLSLSSTRSTAIPLQSSTAPNTLHPSLLILYRLSASSLVLLPVGSPQCQCCHGEEDRALESC